MTRGCFAGLEEIVAAADAAANFVGMIGLREKILSLIAILFALLTAASAQSPNDIAQAPATEKNPLLTPQVTKLLEEVRTLHSKQQYYAALTKLSEVEVIVPDNPVLINVRGSIYTSMRDFAHARECFERAEKIVPDAIEPKFNKVELFFAEMKYPEAEVQFQKLIANTPKLREDLRHLALFKILVCQLKQNKILDAEKTAMSFTFMDDTPAFYYSKAAFAFQKEDKAEGQNWMNKASNIFRADKNAFYIDTLMEARWVESLQVPEAEK